LRNALTQRFDIVCYHVPNALRIGADVFMDDPVAHSGDGGEDIANPFPREPVCGRANGGDAVRKFTKWCAGMDDDEHYVCAIAL